MQRTDKQLLIAALEVVNQVEGLGFSDEDRDRAVELAEYLEEQPDELEFGE